MVGPLGGESRQGAKTVARPLRDYRVVVGAGYFNLSGVHVFSIHLVRGLLARGVDAHLFMTEQETDLVGLPPDAMPIPADIPVRRLPLASRQASWADHWVATIRYLESLEPCVYLPVCDFRHSCVSPKLPPGVSVVGSIQGDDPVHYDHVGRLGAYWDAVACVSQRCADRVAELAPHMVGRIATISNAVPVPEVPAERTGGAPGPLRVIYHGVLNTWQKRILDLPQILARLDALQVPIQLTVLGGGPQQNELAEACRPWVERGQVRFGGIVPNDQVGQFLDQHDVYLLTSRFEGMPHAMLEAMAHGCVPVVSDVDSGVGEVVVSGRNGYRVPIGDVDAFAGRLAHLWRDADSRRAQSLAAHETVRTGRYNVETMVDQYLTLLDRVRADARAGRYRRPGGRVLPPPPQIDGLSIFPVEHGPFVDEVECLLSPSAAAAAPGVMLRRWAKQTWQRLRRRG